MTRLMKTSSAALIAVGVATPLWLWWHGANLAPAIAQTPAARATKTAADTSEDDSSAVRVTVVQPTVEPLRRVTAQPAHIEPFEQTSLFAKASGFIAEVKADIGDRVKKDQVLVELSIPEMQQERVQKLAAIEEARAAVGQSEARVVAAQAMIDAAQARRDEAVATIAQQDAEVAFRQSEHARIVELVNAKSVNEALRDEKLKQLQAAKAGLVAAQAAVRSAEANIKVERARKTQAEADLAHAVAQRKVAEASLRQTDILMEYATIKAPYAGVITRRWANTGDFIRSAAVGQNEPLFTLVKVDPLRIVADIPENDSSLIRDDQPATLTIDALKGRPFAGRVKRSTGVLDPKTRTLRVEIELDKPDPQLRPGMYGALTITLAERKQAILVPSRCLRFEGDRAFVLIAVKGKAEKRTVTIGINDGNRAEILDGLKPDDTVIAESRSPLSPGQPVQATPVKVSK